MTCRSVWATSHRATSTTFTLVSGEARASIALPLVELGDQEVAGCLGGDPLAVDQ
ncbi:hypothetical protein [Kibdelosporangium phytohabitans]|uniref:hypothetical protein n=1 Tax=Kibdelosporangium phytohabitans TaxID=860235 RepID=UPI0012FB46B8|nr:hypothetical protein [Kibdelosporangium phytohabitans]